MVYISSVPYGGSVGLRSGLFDGWEIQASRYVRFLYMFGQNISHARIFQKGYQKIASPVLRPPAKLPTRFEIEGGRLAKYLTTWKHTYCPESCQGNGIENDWKNVGIELWRPGVWHRSVKGSEHLRQDQGPQQTEARGKHDRRLKQASKFLMSQHVLIEGAIRPSATL